MVAFLSPGWMLAGCVLAAVVAVAARRRLADAAGLSTPMAAAWVLTVGVVLSVTVAPRSPRDRYYVFRPGSRACDVVPSQSEILGSVTTAEWTFNLLLLAPLGWICAAAHTRPARRRLLAAAASVPVLVELIQYAATDLHRVCQGFDVPTNWLGLALGHVLGRAFQHRSRGEAAEHPGTVRGTSGPKRRGASMGRNVMRRIRAYVKSNRALRSALFVAQFCYRNLRARRQPARSAAGSGGPTYHLVAMVRVKNEARFLPEWLAHHLNLGVEHFYIYDNHSTDELAAAIEPFETRGLVSVVDWPTVPVSPGSHDDFLERFGPQTRWCLFIDADEFIVERTDGAFSRLLAEHEDWPAIAFNSWYFGTAGHETIPRGLVTEQFRLAEARYNHHVKVVAQPRAIAAYRNPHNFWYSRWRLARTPDGRRVMGTFVEAVGEPEVVVHHYLNRSREDYENKRARGYATAAGQRAQQRAATHEARELAKFNDVPAGVPHHVTAAIAHRLAELGYPDELYLAAPVGERTT